MDHFAYDLCMTLLHCETEEDVVLILKKYGYWDKRDCWRVYGDINNNRSIVGNQQSSPVAALVEKLVNSADAVLTLECYEAGLDPKGENAPSNMQNAIKEFFSVPEGRIQNLNANSRTELAERIRLVTCGTKSAPAFMIIDKGEGQQPEDFAGTFLSLVRENKTQIPFVQGKFNMGGTGVLQFTGKHSFQLIISRRNPQARLADDPIPSNLWGFTLVRRLDPGPRQPQTMYVYLAPDSEIFSFAADSLPLLPGRYPDAYSNPLQYGTCIKLWNYKLPGRLKSLATLDLRYALEQYLPEPALPIRVSERRVGYTANYYDTTISGLCAVLSDKHDDIEPGFDTGSPLTIGNLGLVNLRLVVLKEEIDSSRYPSGILFTVNGQLHGELDSSFISRRTKLEYIAKSMIIMVDCTTLPQRVREDIFLASRDRMRQCDERKALEDALVDYISDHSGLKELNARRRQARLEAAISEENTSDLIKDLIRSDPTLASLFGIGDKAKVVGGPLPEPEKYVGNRFPTFFKLLNEPKSGLQKQCPKNKTFKIELITDAVNDYFSRADDPGRFESIGAPQFRSMHLWNGKATIRYSLPDECNIGDIYNVRIEINDISRLEPFSIQFSVQVAPEVEDERRSSHRENNRSSSIDLPKFHEVRRDSWNLYDFNETSAILIRSNEEAFDVFINMDNIFLRNEISKRKSLNGTLLEHWFKIGIGLLTLGMMRHFQGRQGEQGDDEQDQADISADAREQIAESCKGIASTLIPTLYMLSRQEIMEHLSRKQVATTLETH